MSLFLFINTCGDEAVVALGSDRDGVVREEWMAGRTASEALLGAVRRVLGAVRLPELAGVGVVAGPGSFTGVRVGLAAAKGLCEAAALGLVMMSRLDLVANGSPVANENPLAGPGETAVLDAGRGEYFLSGERIVRGDELPEGLLVTCEARVAERTGARLVAEPGGAAMLRTMLPRVAELAQDDVAWDDVASADASYIRRTDAELAIERAAR